MHKYMSLKRHGGGKKLRWEEKIFFYYFFAFSSKSFALPQETLWSLAKIFAFSRKTFSFLRKNTSCLLYSLEWFIQLNMFTMERFIEFHFELGLKYKEIQSVLSSRHGLGHSV